MQIVHSLINKIQTYSYKTCDIYIKLGRTSFFINNFKHDSVYIRLYQYNRSSIPFVTYICVNNNNNESERANQS